MKKNYLLKISAIVIMLFSTNLQMLAGIGVGVSNPGALPVELTIFSAVAEANNVVLTWQTATEINNYGFEVERQIVGTEYFLSEWETIGFVEGHGNSNSPKNYEFTDDLSTSVLNPISDSLEYRLKQIDTDGKYKYYSLTAKVGTSSTTDLNDALSNELPTKYVLEQNYPNPFNPSTTISYSIPNESNVTIKIFDLLGNEIITLVNQKQAAGIYQTNFNASELSSGVYFYRIQANSLNNSTQYFETKKMSIIK